MAFMAAQSNPPFWYSYDYGSVHFTVLSTEHSLEHDSHQYKVRLVELGLMTGAMRGVGLVL